MIATLASWFTIGYLIIALGVTLWTYFSKGWKFGFWVACAVGFGWLPLLIVLTTED